MGQGDKQKLILFSFTLLLVLSVGLGGIPNVFAGHTFPTINTVGSTAGVKATTFTLGDPGGIFVDCTFTSAGNANIRIFRDSPRVQLGIVSFATVGAGSQSTTFVITDFATFTADRYLISCDFQETGANHNDSVSHKIDIVAPVITSAVGTATIDGVLSVGEWDNAGFVDFNANAPGGGTTPARIFVMDDGNNLYIAIRVQRAALDAFNFANVVFDNDHGAETFNEVGDDRFELFNNSFRDFHWTGSTFALDTSAGGTNDGSGAQGNDGTFTVYELSHPLNSADDTHDFSLAAGDVVGVEFVVRFGATAGTTAITFFPASSANNPSLFGDIVISGDITPPNTTIDSNTQGLTAGDSSNTAAISYTFSSNEAGSTFECNDNGGGFLSCNSPFAQTATAEGAVTFAVRATDLAANTDATPAEFNWVFDTTGPSSPLTTSAVQPTNTSPLNYAVTFNEQIVGDLLILSEISVTGGTAFDLTNPGGTPPTDVFTFSVTPDSNEVNIQVTIPAGVATDAAGNFNLVSNTVIRDFDSVAPTPIITSSEPNPTNSDPLTFTVDFGEPINVSTFVASTDIFVNTGTPQNIVNTGDDQNFTFEVANPIEGPFNVVIAPAVVQDLAGNDNLGSNTFLLTTDYTPPTIAASRAPLANANGWNDSTVTVSYLCADAFSGLDAAATTCDDDVFDTNTLAGTADGEACDLAGNCTAAPQTTDINVDIVFPTIAESRAPLANTNGWNDSTVTVSYLCADAFSGLDLAATTCDDDVFAVNTLAGTADGETCDLAGNCTAAPQTTGINVDFDDPTLQVNSVTPTPVVGPLDGFVKSLKPQTDGDADDAFSGLNRVEVSIDGGEPVLAEIIASWTFTPANDLSEGVTHTLEFTAFDQADNFVSQSIMLTPDVTAPALSIDDATAEKNQITFDDTDRDTTDGATTVSPHPDSPVTTTGTTESGVRVFVVDAEDDSGTNIDWIVDADDSILGTLTSGMNSLSCTNDREAGVANPTPPTIAGPATPQQQASIPTGSPGILYPIPTKVSDDTNATCTGEDNVGNVATILLRFTVEDQQAPIILAQRNTLVPDGFGVLTPIDPDFGFASTFNLEPGGTAVAADLVSSFGAGLVVTDDRPGANATPEETAPTLCNELSDVDNTTSENDGDIQPCWYAINNEIIYTAKDTALLTTTSTQILAVNPTGIQIGWVDTADGTTTVQTTQISVDNGQRHLEVTSYRANLNNDVRDSLVVLVTSKPTPGSGFPDETIKVTLTEDEDNIGVFRGGPVTFGSSVTTNDAADTLFALTTWGIEATYETESVDNNPATATNPANGAALADSATITGTMINCNSSLGCAGATATADDPILLDGGTDVAQQFTGSHILQVFDPELKDNGAFNERPTFSFFKAQSDCNAVNGNHPNQLYFTPVDLLMTEIDDTGVFVNDRGIGFRDALTDRPTKVFQAKTDGTGCGGTEDNIVTFTYNNPDTGTKYNDDIDADFPALKITVVDAPEEHLALETIGADFELRLNCIADTDGDAICDEWESEDGIAISVDLFDELDNFLRTISYELPCGPTEDDKTCPSQTRKDYYVEIDWMENHEPPQAAIQDVVDAFAIAPTPNPGGDAGSTEADGITLHVLVADASYRDHKNTLPFDTTGGVLGFFDSKNVAFGTTTEQAADTTQAILKYDAQSADFTVGSTLTGGTSGATGTIVADVDQGVQGTLTLSSVVAGAGGFFQDGETITNPGGSATANGDSQAFATCDGCQGTVQDIITLKRQFFHYVQFWHDQEGAEGVSGTGEQGGQDAIVSLGSFAGGVGTRSDVASTLMHEFGHNLNINHGGEHFATLNCKPQMISVMNYAYMFPDLVPDRPLDFQRTYLAQLITSKLVEIDGVQAYFYPDPTNAVPADNRLLNFVYGFFDGEPRVSSTGVGVDWERNGSVDPNPDHTKDIPINQINIPGCENLNLVKAYTGVDQWSIIEFNIRTSDVFNSGSSHRSTTSGNNRGNDEPTKETHGQIMSDTLIPLRNEIKKLSPFDDCTQTDLDFLEAEVERIRDIHNSPATRNSNIIEVKAELEALKGTDEYGRCIGEDSDTDNQANTSIELHADLGNAEVPILITNEIIRVNSRGNVPVQIIGHPGADDEFDPSFVDVTTLVFGLEDSETAVPTAHDLTKKKLFEKHFEFIDTDGDGITDIIILVIHYKMNETGLDPANNTIDTDGDGIPDSQNLCIKGERFVETGAGTVRVPFTGCQIHPVTDVGGPKK